MTPTIADVLMGSFWSRVDKFGPVWTDGSRCWDWTGAHNAKGYGHVAIRRRNHGAHRVSWLLATGDFPVGVFVCHRCDRPCCVNPLHLFLGSGRDNVRDCLSKGRRVTLRGEGAPWSKLTGAQVADARTRARLGESCASISRTFGVSDAAIRLIIKNKNWRVAEDSLDEKDRLMASEALRLTDDVTSARRKLDQLLAERERLGRRVATLTPGAKKIFDLQMGAK